MTILNGLRPATCLLALGMGLIPMTSAHSEDPAREREHFFESHVRPLFIEKCVDCHGTDKQSGGLRLDSLPAMLHGGESGPALVPNEVDQSLIIEAVRYESLEMPPDGQLTDEEIQTLATWIEQGAVWPNADPADFQPLPTDILTEADRDFWSLKPVERPEVPQVEEDTWSRGPIDRFILRRLQEAKLNPAPASSARTLVRRIYLDLTGLPPTAEQMSEFLADPSEAAYQALVDRLLRSPQSAEHWASSWLDLVRYAESDGFRQDAYREDAWRYRDYVISAFHSNKPYDQFVREQLAGDELRPGDPEALAATGFLRLGIFEYNQRDAPQQWQDMLNDVTDTVGDVFLGLGVGCARCHNHKFDPILQKDYYRLQAYFANTAFVDEEPLATAQQIAVYEQQLAEWEQATAEIRDELRTIEDPVRDELRTVAVIRFPDDIQALMAKPESERTSYEKQICHLVELQVLDGWKGLAAKIPKASKERWQQLQKQLEEFDELKPHPLPSGRTVADYSSTPPDVHIPDKERLGAVAPGVLSVLNPNDADIKSPTACPDSSGRRLALANWLTQADNPLVPRVIVNRMWKQHFGEGLVASTSDFGHLGETPSHPELLDWLTSEFVARGWDLRWLHREIVLSSAFRQASLCQNSDAQRVDPDTRLLWRFPIRRLRAEEIHDSLLLISGELDTAVGGASCNPEKSTRRAIYQKVMRNTPDPLLAAFDFPDRVTSTGERNNTTTPTQSLLLMNGDWMVQRAQAFARRLESQSPENRAEQTRQAFLLAFGREPEPEEIEAISEYLADADSAEPEHSAATDEVATNVSTSGDNAPEMASADASPLVDLCHVLMNSNEFLYVE